MRVQPSAAILLFVALTLSSCRPAAEETEADVAAIQAVAAEWIAAVNAGDLARVVAEYTDDAVRMPPGRPAYVGKEAIEEDFRGSFEQFSAEFTWPTEEEEIVVADGWAFHRDNYTARLTPVAGGEVIEVVGKVIVIFQQQPDGSWKHAREIWNSDNPPPAME